MKDLVIRVAQDATMPPGRCVVLVEDDIAYIGKLGHHVLKFLDMPDAVIILNPADFAGSMDYIRHQSRLN
jgi:hypothetical protein